MDTAAAQTEEVFIKRTHENNNDNDNHNVSIITAIQKTDNNNNGDSHKYIDDEEHQMQMKMKKQLKKQARQERKIRRKEKISNTPCNTFLGKHKWLGGAVDPNSGKIYGIPAHSYQIICITPSNPSLNEEAEISTIPLPNEYQQGQYKWLRGLIHDNYLYGIPAWNTKGILKVSLDPSLSGSGSANKNNRVKVLPLPRDFCYYRNSKATILDNSNDVDDTKDTTSSSTTTTNHNDIDVVQDNHRHKFMSIDRGRWMWHGGTIGKFTNEKDGGKAIYCIPSNATHVIKVYLDGTDRVEEIGTSLSEGQNKW